MFRDPKYLPIRHLHRAQLALIKLYDNYFSPGNFNYKFYQAVDAAEKRFGKMEKDTLFAGYFTEEGQKAVPGLPADVKASLYVRPGKGALIFVSNLGTKAESVRINLNLKAWNLKTFDIFDGESRKVLDLSRSITIPKHDFVLIEVKAK